jgi:CheY-like chemotaxis protein
VRRATTVLVVEDDAAIRNMIVEALKLEGYDPSAVSNTPAALDHIRGRRPDLIITDYHLPGADGLELLRALQAEGFGDVPALVISADARPPDLPVTSFIPKPFELEAILRAVRRVLGKRPDDSDQRAESRAPGRLAWASWLASPEMALA